MQTVVLGLGSNQGNRINHLRDAIQFIDQLNNTSVLQRSAVFQSPALLKPGSPDDWAVDFYNACVSITTELSPLDLLNELKHIEQTLGRNLQAQRWSPRVIDIDILTWDDQVIVSDQLHIPHVGLLERNFALLPLLHINPLWKHPGYLDVNLHSYAKRLPPLPYAPFQLTGPKLMGILNLSVDSFSSDGQCNLEHCHQQLIDMVNAGAEIIDIGAVSTNPKAKEGNETDEWRLLAPLCDQLQSWLDDQSLAHRPLISIDTYHAKTVEKLLNYPIDIINDVYGYEAQAIAHQLKNTSLKYISMHHCGKAGQRYLDINIPAIEQLVQYFNDQKHLLVEYGLVSEQLIFDVGIGFGKHTFQVNNILEHLSALKDLNVEILLGHSRKASIAESTQVYESFERDFETAVISAKVKYQTDYVRVHNIPMNRRALNIG